jgi:hypothetical protein
MAASNLASISALYEQRQQWKVETIMFDVIDDMELGTTKSENIARFIGMRKSKKGYKGEKIYFADFNQNTVEYRKHILFPAFKAACRPSGFFATSQGAEANCYCIVCNHCKQYNPQKQKEEQAGEPPTGNNHSNDGSLDISASNPAPARRTVITKTN